jgi:hypothetical protein
VESTVEPTRSENITVTCRRSVVSSGSAAADAATSATAGVLFSVVVSRLEIVRNSLRAPMTERRNAHLFEVLIGQVTQDREVDIVIDKALERPAWRCSPPSSHAPTKSSN